MNLAHLSDHSNLSLAQQIVHFFSGIHLILLLSIIALLIAVAVEVNSKKERPNQ